MDKIMNWCISVWESEEDFLLEWDVSLPELHKQDNVRFSYNQWSSSDCTLYWPTGAISDLFNHEFTAQNIGDIVEMSYTRGRARDKGWQTQLGVKCTVDWRNEHNENKVLYFRIAIWDNVYMDALKKWYTIVVSYKGNNDFNKDFFDGVLDGVDFKPQQYWHCTTNIALLYMDDGKMYIKDSYKWRKGKDGIDTNIYQIKNIISLVKNGVFYPACYIIIPEEKTANKEEDFKRLTAFRNEITKSMASHSAMWNLTNDTM